MRRVGSTIRISAEPKGDRGRCPRCDGESARVHSRYRRQLADTAIGGHPVMIDLRVRRFFCDTIDCTAKTFAEQVPGLTKSRSRRTPVLGAMVTAIGLAVAGRAGARLATRLGVTVGRDTLLRAVRAMSDPKVGEVSILGIDDFAIRRGHVYGTLVLDMVTSRPIDLLADRTTDTVADWLKEHPGAEVVCRDRAGAYAEGIRVGAPDAVQVADRWHLWHNLADAVEKTVTRHRADLRLPVEEAEDVDVVTAGIDEYARPASEPIDGRLVTRTRERHAAVRQLASQGMSISAIGRKLSLDRRTVRRFARATEVEELLTKAESRASLLDEFKPHLHERFNAGCTDAARLTREIALLGYRGSDKTVRRYLQPLRSARDPLPSGPTAPSVRQATGWLTRHPDRLTDDERTALEALLERSPALATTRDLVHDFAEIMVERRGRDLGAWMTAVDANGDRALRSFVTGLRRDLDAVTAGLTLPYSSGPVEGHINRIKMLKRQMYGRANLDLLRKRVIHTV
ncbi:ISL3 family transposase [Rhodococcus sp. NM-2]|uniref:ISL3 family transposase n=1 Tax=Rhodococcus sp. NM-2 TaxID=3401174 RepID=UPI003AAA835C